MFKQQSQSRPVRFGKTSSPPPHAKFATQVQAPENFATTRFYTNRSIVHSDDPKGLLRVSSQQVVLLLLSFHPDFALCAFSQTRKSGNVLTQYQAPEWCQACSSDTRKNRVVKLTFLVRPARSFLFVVVHSNETAYKLHRLQTL